MNDNTQTDNVLTVDLPQYLYHVESLTHTGYSLDTLIKEKLNKLGPQGWELVSVTEVALPTQYWKNGEFKEQPYLITAYFKLKWPSSMPRFPVPENE